MENKLNEIWQFVKCLESGEQNKEQQVVLLVDEDNCSSTGGGTAATIYSMPGYPGFVF